MAVDLERSRRDFDFVLILSGGNALGAFHAGVYQALHEAGIEPDWVIGGSAGAVTAALIVGNKPDERLAKLAEFWQPSDIAGERRRGPFETFRRSAAAQWTMTAGRTGIFGPVTSGMRWLRPGAAETPSLFDTEQLAATLNALVDFDRLNDGGIRLTVTATDIETGDEVTFDSDTQTIHADHIRASAALPVAFPAIEIDGRWLVDAGISANLPLDPFFAAPPAAPAFCLAVDLLPLNGERPATIGEAASRMQDLVFAAQSRRSLARWSDHYRRQPSEDQSSIAFARMAYTAQADEVAGKAMDFSPLSVRDRWQAGLTKTRSLIKSLERGELSIGARGFREIKIEDREQEVGFEGR